MKKQQLKNLITNLITNPNLVMTKKTEAPVRPVTNRLEKKSTYDTSELEVDLMKTYPKDSQLGRQRQRHTLFTRQGSLQIYADLCVPEKLTNSKSY